MTLKSLIFSLLFINALNIHAQEVCMVTADFQTGETYIVNWQPIYNASEVDSVLIYKKQGVQSGFSHLPFKH